MTTKVIALHTTVQRSNGDVLICLHNGTVAFALDAADAQRRIKRLDAAIAKRSGGKPVVNSITWDGFSTEELAAIGVKAAS